MLLAVVETNSCRPPSPEDIILITTLMVGLLGYAAMVSVSVPAIKMTLSAAVAKVLAGLSVGFNWTTIIVPLKAFLHIAAVAAVVESIKHILGCG